MKKTLRKLRRAADYALVFCHIPIILLVRLIRPLVWIRFGWLHTHKIGHHPLESELYLCERLSGFQPARTLDFFYDRRRGGGIVGNEQTIIMAKRHLKIWPYVRYLFESNRLVPGSAKHEVYIKAREEYNCRDREGLFTRFPTQIGLTSEEMERGWKALEQMGIPRSAKFICVHVRDATYWRHRKANIGNDSDYRNSDIQDFIPAIKAILDRGFYVLRVGFPVSGRLPVEHPRFIDYSYEHRSPFMDVFLGATCHLMISTGSGIDSMSYMFRRPILMCNLAPVGLLYSDSPLIVNIAKLHRRKGEANLMTYREVHASGADHFELTNDFIEHGIEYLDVSPDVLRRAALEAIDRLDGTWQETMEDRAMADRFWKIYADDPYHQNVRGHISGEFLRAYRHLL